MLDPVIDECMLGLHPQLFLVPAIRSGWVHRGNELAYIAIVQKIGEATRVRGVYLVKISLALQCFYAGPFVARLDTHIPTIVTLL